MCWIGKVGCGHQEWASDWKDLNGLIKPLIQQHEAAEAEMASRQAAAQEGMDLFQRFAQLKDLQIKELQPGPSGVVQLEKIMEKQHFKNRQEWRLLRTSKKYMMKRGEVKKRA